MTDLDSYREKFVQLNCCVIVPTYNNSKTVAKVISDVLEYTDDVIVVNDGATDNTPEIIAGFGNKIQLVNFSENKGKGAALRQGFKYAVSKGYRYAITIDSDGQHFAKDIPAFLTKIESEPDSLIVGARNMNQDSVPGKSSFGHKFSNFWYNFETGIQLPDTQSGYRLYPVALLSGMHFFTTKFEFEIEVIVRAAWKGIPVTSVPVSVYYGSERISHFRPGKDFTRISILNTVLVLIAVLYIKPRDFFRKLKKKEFRKSIRESILDANESNLRKSLAIAFGIFIGIVPIWGYQLLVGFPLAHLFKLNKAIFFAAANISIPPMIPVILYLSYKTGALVVQNPSDDLLFSSGFSLELLKSNIYQYAIGSMLLAVVAAITIGFISFILFSLFRKENKAQN